MRKIKYFTASWCAPCKMLKPIMMDMISEGYNIDVIDIDENIEEPGQYGVRSVPTCIVMDGDTEITRWSGVKQRTEIMQLYNS
jgi:thioredoxin 1